MANDGFTPNQLAGLWVYFDTMQSKIKDGCGI